MTLCPIAIAVGCRKCPVFKLCPVKGLLGDVPKAAEVKPVVPAAKPRPAAEARTPAKPRPAAKPQAAAKPRQPAKPRAAATKRAGKAAE